MQLDQFGRKGRKDQLLPLGARQTVGVDTERPGNQRQQKEPDQNPMNQLPAPQGHSAPRLGLLARGDLSKMEVGIGGRAPEPLRATLTLGGSVSGSESSVGAGVGFGW